MIHFPYRYKSLAMVFVSQVFLIQHAGAAELEQAPKILIEAHSVAYKDMKAAGIEKNKSLDYCCSLLVSPGTPPEQSKFALNQAYFVRVKVNNVALARKLFKDSCQASGLNQPPKACSKEVLASKVDEALSKPYLGSLYGKFRARWIAYVDKTKVHETERWIGQSVYSFSRKEGVDELVLGPMPDQPTQLVLGYDLDEIRVLDFRAAPAFSSGKP